PSRLRRSPKGFLICSAVAPRFRAVYHVPVEPAHPAALALLEPPMNPIEFALRRPITVIVAIVALVAGGWLALTRMKVHIFPALNLPVIYVAQPYGGMDPTQMEGLIANYY